MRGRAREMDRVSAWEGGDPGNEEETLRPDPLLPKTPTCFLVGRAFYTPEIFVESWFGV